MASNNNLNNKRYYWIKLQTNFFNEKTIDFLLSQPNGCEYVVLYQMLCLNTANNEGCLSTNMGEIIIPYDIEKIARDTKYFNTDTVRVALELYKRLGMIYEQNDKILRIADFDNMVGSITQSAIYKQKKQDKKELETSWKISNRDRDKILDIDNRYNNINIITTTTNNNNIYSEIEENFGRTLNPIEYEKVNSWLSSFNNEVISYALKIAVLNNKKSFSYVNGILNNWKTSGFKSLNEIKENEKEKEAPKLSDEKRKELEEAFKYDWLNDK